jgi:hypothetical protein
VFVVTADPLGTLELDFGPRRFFVRFDRDGMPFLVDGSKNRISTLPKPVRADDPVMAQEAAEHWKALKIAARILANEQLVELETAMGSERRFSSEAFKASIVGHPVVTQLAQRLVWEVIAPAMPRVTFRVLEDRSFVQVDDTPFALPDDASVGLVHRLAMDDEVVVAWLDHFRRHEVLQPFDQLERTRYTIADAERDSPLLDRIKGMTVQTSKVLRLEQRGWRKLHRGHLSRFTAASSELHERFGTAEREGWLWQWEKILHSPSDVREEARMHWPDGVYIALQMFAGGEHTVGRRPLADEHILAAGFIGPAWLRISSADRLTQPTDAPDPTFGALSAIAFSELIRELEMLKP